MGQLACGENQSSVSIISWTMTKYVILFVKIEQRRASQKHSVKGKANEMKKDTQRHLLPSLLFSVSFTMGLSVIYGSV